MGENDPRNPQGLLSLQVQRALPHLSRAPEKAHAVGKASTQPCAVWEGEGGVIQQNLPGEQSLHP